MEEATKDFDIINLLGKDVFGSIAVKRMVVTGGKGCSDQFEAEVSVLPRVHHRNHVILHGYFIQGDKKLFVYKYMPQ
ncbi:hypothetical protein HID58_057423, partial [Brassica napus]